MPRKMYRTHRAEYQGCEVKGESLRVHLQQQALQGPAGWQDFGPRQWLDIPLSTLLAPEVTEALDTIVRRQLKKIWDPTTLEERLF